MLRPATRGRPVVEPQARAPRVLRAAPESAAPGTTAADRAAGTEPHLGARLHERDALRRPTCPVADGHRRRESGGLGDRDGPVGAQSARRPGAQRTRGRPRLPGGLADGQRAGISRAAVHRLVHRPPGGDPLHPAGQARAECLHRAVQPELSHGGAQRPSL